jgi:hypothetical protein
MGAGALSKLRRLTAAGPVNLPLDRELRLMESLFYGAYLNTAREIGMTPEAAGAADLGLGPRRSLAAYRLWKPRKDPDVSQDLRMMVPVFYDVQRRKIKVWAVLGVAARYLHIRYEKPPKLKAVKGPDGNAMDPALVKMTHPMGRQVIVYPVMAELYVTRLLDRKEFRALCDEHKTRPAILAHLE